MEYILPDKAQELLRSIHPDMVLTKKFFKHTYGWEIDCPGFAERALTALEAAGCSHAREYYETWVREYEAERDAMLKRVSVWYSGELKRRQKGKERQMGRMEKGQKEGEEKREKKTQDRVREWKELSRILDFQ